MHIFLSYARADAKTAEPIAANLKQAGHEVFFDCSDIAPAEDFNRVIWKKIRKVDLFVFLISPNSLRSGSYALTELALAEKRWPNPERRVLAVVIEATDYASIPVYATICHMLYPKGNVAFEVRAEVNALGRKRRLRQLVRAAATAAVLLLAGSLAVLGYREYLGQRPFAARERLVAMNVFDVEDFVETAFKGDVKLMELYLTAGMDPNVQIEGTQRGGTTALMMAVNGEHPDVVAMLLEAGADVNARNIWGETALAFAAMEGQDACLRMLLAAGADSQIVDNALVHAASVGQLSSLRMLLNYGVRQSAIEDAFIVAARSGHVALLRTLSDRVAAPPKAASAALLAVAGADKAVFREIPEAARIETFNYLLALGADMNTRNERGFTLLSLAVSQQNLKLAGVLLENHAPIDMHSKCINGGGGWTPLTLAIEKEVSTLSDDDHADAASMTALLIARGADVNLAMGKGCHDEKESDGRTPLMLAVGGEDVEIVRTLLEKGAYVNARDHQGYTALAYATGNKDILALLLASGADLHAGGNPLLPMVAQNKYQETERLLEAGADVNKRDTEGTTPLMLAAKEANPNMVQLLLRAGARATDKDNMGRTAETFAMRSRADEIVELLRNAQK